MSATPLFLVQQFIEQSHTGSNSDVALSDPSCQLTWQELRSRTSRLAHCLKKNGIRRQDRVVICLQRSAWCIVAMLGILKADAIYVPMDEKAPDERMRKIIQDSNPGAVICDDKTIGRINAVIGLTGFKPAVFLLNSTKIPPEGIGAKLVVQPQIDACAPSPPVFENIDADIAYILYTSGSTGNPKGVMISHANIFNYIEWAADYLEITSDDVILSTAPFHFDMSVFDIYCALKTGARLAIASPGLLLFPNRLVDFMERERVTIWKGVSSLLMYIARTGALKPGRLPLLRRILFAGEVLPTRYLMDWMTCFPDKIFYNGYGPTEATGMSACYRVPDIPKRREEIIPIGKSRANTELFLLDEAGRPVARGEVGELCIRGAGLSPGYWNDVKKTREKFVLNPAGAAGDRIYKTGDLCRIRADGNFEYKSRMDDQVKWMGYRIELGEIENIMRAMDSVEDVTVVMTGGESDADREIVAFVEGVSGAGIKDLINQVNCSLPGYMRPRRIIPIDRIPRNERGKVDRQELKRFHLRIGPALKDPPRRPQKNPGQSASI